MHKKINLQRDLLSLGTIITVEQPAVTDENISQNNNQNNGSTINILNNSNYGNTNNSNNTSNNNVNNNAEKQNSNKINIGNR